LGNFRWRIGEEEESNSVELKAGLEQPQVVDEDTDGFLTARQVGIDSLNSIFFN